MPSFNATAFGLDSTETLLFDAVLKVCFTSFHCHIGLILIVGVIVRFTAPFSVLAEATGVFINLVQT